jgi:hypothetical protein
MPLLIPGSIPGLVLSWRGETWRESERYPAISDGLPPALKYLFRRDNLLGIWYAKVLELI